ncbi:MAG: VWA domain-containing protein [Pararobbsia sp.]
MLIDFFFALRDAKLPVSVNEYLTLVGALERNVIAPSIDAFYYLARLTLIKDEQHYDKFDQAFGAYFNGVSARLEAGLDPAAIPLDWLRQRIEREFSPEEKARIEAMGGLDALLEQLAQRLDEQDARHEGGDRWIGTGGTSPFGRGGFNPEGIRIGGDAGGSRQGVKVWNAREYRDYDDGVELGTRSIQIALRRLRRFARKGAAEELDLDDTIRRTAANAGWLDLRMVPERHNTAKVLMLLDVGGSMDDHVRRTEELFSAARGAFKHLEFFYFHNCVYDVLWKHNRRRHTEKFATWDVLHKYPSEYKLIFVGDATMGPYEILQPGGSVEYTNAEAGAVWLARLTERYPSHAWLNPEPERLWEYRQSVALIRQLMSNRMFPLTLAGLDGAMRLLSK